MNDRPRRPFDKPQHAKPSRFAGGPRHRERPAGRPFGEWPDDVAILYGWHSVVEALRNPRRRFRRLMTTENALNRLKDESIPLRVEPELVRPGAIDRLLDPDAVHQGMLAECDPLPALKLKDAAQSDLLARICG